jgi:hypothetical protein
VVALFLLGHPRKIFALDFLIFYPYIIANPFCESEATHENRKPTTTAGRRVADRACAKNCACFLKILYVYYNVKIGTYP